MEVADGRYPFGHPALGVSLLTGKRFRLHRATIALDGPNGKHRAVTIPMGAIVQVHSGRHDGNGMVSVQWGERFVEMFEIDLTVRGSELRDE